MRISGYMRYLWFLLVPCFVGCTTSGIGEELRPVAGNDYSFSANDELSERRFSVTLVSMSKREICTEAWPSDAGKMDVGPQTTFVATRDVRYYFEGFVSDYCPFRACANPMKRDERLVAFLYYKDFGLPEELFTSTKQLVFDPKPYWCDTRKWTN